MCGSHRRHHRSRADDLDAWEARYAAGPAPAPSPPDPHRPVAEGDKDVAVAALRRHAGDGVIDLDEFGDRTERVLAASSAADLDAVFADLPGPAPMFAIPAPPPAPARVRRRHHGHPVPSTLRAIAPLAAVLVGIWALTGFGYFWPAWPLLFVAFFSLKHRAHRWGPPDWA